MSDEMIAQDGGFEFRLEQCIYKGELWYSCKIFLGDYGLMAHGRTAARALGFAMEALGRAAIEGRVVIDDWDSPVKPELTDVEFSYGND